MSGKHLGVTRKWLVIIATGVGTGLFITMFGRLDLTSVFFSWTLNFSLMFCYSVIESQLKPSLQSTYFTSKAFEQQGKIYTLLGVLIYRKFLVCTHWEKLSQKANPVKKSLEALRKYEHATRVSEFGHTLIALVVLVFTVYVSMKYSAKEAVWLFLFNILLNIYPIMVQRYNRPRVQRVLQKAAIVPAS
jgi:hypothetical protein